MLLRSEDRSYGVARARVESVAIAFKPVAILEADTYDTDAENKTTAPISTENSLVSKTSKDMLVSIEKRLKTISTVLSFGLGVIVAALLLR